MDKGAVNSCVGWEGWSSWLRKVLWVVLFGRGQTVLGFVFVVYMVLRSDKFFIVLELWIIKGVLGECRWEGKAKVKVKRGRSW
jgi:hypothetical protein